MRTVPKKLFSSSVNSAGTTVTASDKWIITDLYITNASGDFSEVTIEHDSDILFGGVEVDGNSTIKLGNIIMEENEEFYAEASQEITITAYGRVV